MRAFAVLFLLAATCSGESPTASDASPHENHHVINQLTDGAAPMDDDSGAPDGGVTQDARIAVAYCAAEVLDKLPKLCQVEVASDALKTVCDTGLSITWNCDRCGDVERRGAVIGHILMTSPVRFEVKSIAASAPLFICTLDDNGAGFVVEQAK